VKATYTIDDEESVEFNTGDYVPSRATISIKYIPDPCYYSFVNWTTSNSANLNSFNATETASPKEFTVKPSEFRATNTSASPPITQSTDATITCNITPVIYNIYYEGGNASTDHFTYAQKKNSAGYSTTVSILINPVNDPEHPDIDYYIDHVYFKDELGNDITGIISSSSDYRFTFEMPAQDVYISVTVQNESYDDFRTWGTGDSRWSGKIYSANNGANTMNASTRVVGGSDVIMAYIKLLIQAGFTPSNIPAYDSLESATNETHVEGIVDKLNVSPYPYDQGLVKNDQESWANIAKRLEITNNSSYCSFGATAGGATRDSAFMFPKLLTNEKTAHTGGDSNFSLTKTVNNNENAYTKLLLDYLEGSCSRAGVSTFPNGSCDYIANSKEYKFSLMIYVNDTFGWVAVDEAQLLSTGEIWVWASHNRVSNNNTGTSNIVKLSTISSTFERVAGFKFTNGDLHYGSTKVEFSRPAADDSTVNNTLGATYVYLGKTYPTSGTKSSPIYVPRNADLRISGAYAGQSVTITPTGIAAKNGTISYQDDNNNSSPFVYTSPKNIGLDPEATSDYTFNIIPTNSSINNTPAVTVTVNVTYSPIQKAYIKLYNSYILHRDKGVTLYDILDVPEKQTLYSAFDGSLTNAAGAVSDKIINPNYVVDYNTNSPTTSYYDGLRSDLEDAFDAVNRKLKTNTIYVLANYSDNVKIHVWNTEKQNKLFETEADPVASGNTEDFLMKYEGETNTENIHKYLYSFEYKGYCSFIIYRASGTTILDLDDDDVDFMLTDDVRLNDATSNNVAYDSSNSRYKYGKYYLDLKDVTTSASPEATVSDVAKFEDFTGNSIVVNEITNDLFNLCETNDVGYSLNDIMSRLDISYRNSSLAGPASSGGSAQTVSYTSFTVTRPGASSGVSYNSNQKWKPTDPGKYEITLHASLGTAESNSTVSFSADYQNLYFYVAYDKITIYADMNDNPGNPILYVPYTDSVTHLNGFLPYEFFLVPGSDAIYSTEISLTNLRDNYDIDLVENGRIPVSKVVVNDYEETTYSGFDISRTVARTGTLWLKADSTHMKFFNNIAFNSSTKTFKAVLRNNGDTDYNNEFADIRTNGVLDEDLINGSYRYSVLYGAKDTTNETAFFTGDGTECEFEIANGGSISTIRSVKVDGVSTTDYTADLNKRTITFTNAPASGKPIVIDYVYTYNFGYNVKAKAKTDISYGGNYYYFDHWALYDKTGTLTEENYISSTDINLNKAPNNADGDYTYVAVYTPSGEQNKRVQITYNFKDYNTDDGNYIYDPDKPPKNASYTKTVKLSDIIVNNQHVSEINGGENGNAVAAAASVQPMIKSNYFDYTLENQTVREEDVTTTNNGTMYKYEVTMTHTPHKYKVIYYNGTTSIVYKGYYQQTVDQAYEVKDINNPQRQISAAPLDAGTDSDWYIEQNGENAVIGKGRTYNARFGMYQDSGEETEDGITYKFDWYTVKATARTNSVYSSIAPAHQETFYENDTQKVRHNFYIIDATAFGTLVGGGVLYATAENGAYRQNSASVHLANAESQKTFINGILNGNYDEEYKSQTIDNVGFRYLPYKKGMDVFRYSDEMQAYLYTYGAVNTND
ncbi:MAG: DUF2460 domain-containing protein, partial [Ruminococcus sp.]|nr:DUF2460 domain-containing protein [Ruminococcus sp.]